jgi:hypothetical protein
MGYTTAQELSEILDLEGGIAMHLQVNHYPPVPRSMVKPCIEAIDAYNDNYETHKLIELPEGVTWRGETSAPAWALIEAHHLDPWLVHAWDCDCSDCLVSDEE